MKNITTLLLLFQHNILATIAVVEMPFMLVCAAVDRGHFQRLRIAERIQAKIDTLKADKETAEGIEEAEEHQALERATEKLDEFRQSDDGKSTYVNECCHFLIHSSRDDKLRNAADELTLQGAVLLWGAIEVLCRDSFVMYLNTHPQAAKLFLVQPDLRKAL
jgi:hypothetical protein